MLREGNERRDFAVIDYVFYMVYYDARILWAALEGVKMSHKVADRLGRAKKRSQSSFWRLWSGGKACPCL